jgi:DHA3 family macrolide efflux protein-like MFS transporter
MAVGANVDVTAKPALGTNFSLLWAGQFVSQIGDRFAMVAFPWLVYSYSPTKSLFRAGVMLAFYALPYGLFGAIAGVAIDRFNKRRLMIGADLARAALVLLVPLAATHSMPMVYVLSFTMSSVSVFFDPCKLALLPDLVSGQQLMRANSLLATGETLTEVLGFAIGGFASKHLLPHFVFSLDAATFGVSALALSAIRYTPPLREVVHDVTRNAGADIRQALAYLRGNRALLVNTALVLFAAVGIGASMPLTFVFAAKTLHGGPTDFGLMEAALAAGYLVGALGMAGLAIRAHIGLATTLGLLTMGLGFAAVAMTSSVVVTMLPLFIVGVGNAIALISIDTFFQQTVAEQLRGRVLGVRFTMTQTVIALSVLGGAAAVSVFPVRTLFVVAGAVIALPGLVGLLFPRLRES